MSKLTVLDQPVRVSALDKSHMLELCEKTPYLYRDAAKLARKVKVPNEIMISDKIKIRYKTPKNVVVAGMGGSAIGGELLGDWLYDEVSIPVQVCRDYVLPAYADENTLVIAVSYSGETEETLSAFVEALKRRCMVFALSSGGHLQAFSQKTKIPHISIPSGFPAPRAAIAYTFFPLVVLMEKLHVTDKTEKEIEEALKVMRKVRMENGLGVPLKNNPAKKLAVELKDTIPTIYGFRPYCAVARRLKCQFNENSKVPSKIDCFPELCHNEVVGWEASRNLTKTFSVIFIRAPNEPTEIKRRIELTKQIVSSKVSKIAEIKAEGRQKLARMLSATYVGDYVSIYLGLLRGVDPTPTKTISQLKEHMKEKLHMMRKFEREIERMK